MEKRIIADVRTTSENKKYVVLTDTITRDVIDLTVDELNELCAWAKDVQNEVDDDWWAKGIRKDTTGIWMNDDAMCDPCFGYEFSKEEYLRILGNIETDDPILDKTIHNNLNEISRHTRGDTRDEFDFYIDKEYVDSVLKLRDWFGRLELNDTTRPNVFIGEDDTLSFEWGVFVDLQLDLRTMRGTLTFTGELYEDDTKEDVILRNIDDVKDIIKKVEGYYGDFEGGVED